MENAHGLGRTVCHPIAEMLDSDHKICQSSMADPPEIAKIKYGY